MALASEEESQIDRFLNRNSSIEAQKQFDLSQWKIELKKVADTNDCKEIVDFIRRCIESIICSSNKNYIQQTLNANKCFTLLKDIINEEWRNEFIKSVTKLIFDVIIEEATDYWCIKKELLKIFNSWVKLTSYPTKQLTIKGLSQMYLCKMVDNINSYGDYDLQLTIIEAIFRMYGKSEINKRLNDLIPESEELSQTFADINPKTFDEDCRLFLNIINQKHGKIFSIICDSVQIGNVICEQPMTTGLWLDFNLWDKAISWYHLRTNGPNQTFWELVTLFVSEIAKTNIQRKSDFYCIHFELRGHLIVSSDDDPTCLNQSKNIIIILRINEEAEKLVSSVLPNLIQSNKPSPKSTKKCSTAKMVYKPLNIKVSKLANKSLISQNKSEVSSTYKLLQPLSTLHTSTGSKSVNSSRNRTANLDSKKYSSESEDKIISIHSSEDPNKYLSAEDTSLFQMSQRTQILSGKCTGSDFKYHQIIKSQKESGSLDKYSTAEEYVRNSTKVSAHKNQRTNNSSSDKWKTAEEGPTEDYDARKVLKVSNRSNLNKKSANHEIIEDLYSMKVNIHEYDLTEKENLNKVNHIKIKEGSEPKVSKNILEKVNEEKDRIPSLDDSMDFAERMICSTDIIPESTQKTTLKSCDKEDLSVPQEEAVKIASNLEKSAKTDKEEETVEREKEIVPKVSKFKNKQISKVDQEIVPKVSKFKNKQISKVDHSIKETNKILREEGSSKSDKNISKSVKNKYLNRVEGADKTFLEEIDTKKLKKIKQQKFIQGTLNDVQKLPEETETFKPDETYPKLTQTVKSKTKSEKEEKQCLKATGEKTGDLIKYQLPEPDDNILQENDTTNKSTIEENKNQEIDKLISPNKIEYQKTIYPKRQSLEPSNVAEKDTIESGKSFNRKISTNDEYITKNTVTTDIKAHVLLSADYGDEEQFKEREKNNREYSTRTTRKITSDDGESNGYDDINTQTTTTAIIEHVISAVDGDEEKPKETEEKKRRYSKRRTIKSTIKKIASDDEQLSGAEDIIKNVETTEMKENSNEEKPKATEDKKRRYSKRRTITSTIKKIVSDDESGAEYVEKRNETEQKKHIYSKRRTVTPTTEKIVSDAEEFNGAEELEKRKVTQENNRTYPKRRRTNALATEKQDVSVKEENKNEMSAEHGLTNEESRKIDDKKQRYSKRRVSKKYERYVVEKPRSASEVINTEYIESNEDSRSKVIEKSIINKKKAFYEKESSLKTSYEKSKIEDKDEMQGYKNYEDVNIQKVENVETVESPILSQNWQCNSKKMKEAQPHLAAMSEEEIKLKMTLVTPISDNELKQSQSEAYEALTQKNTPTDIEKSNKIQQRDINIENNSNMSDKSEEYVPLEPEIRPIIDPEKEFDNLVKQILPIKQMYKTPDDTITKSEDRINVAAKTVDFEGHRNDFKKVLASDQESQINQFAQQQIRDQYENVIGDITIETHPSLLRKSLVDNPLKTNNLEPVTEKIKLVQFDIKSQSNSSIRTRDLNQTISTTFSRRKRKLYDPNEITIINREEPLEVKKNKKLEPKIEKEVLDTTILTKRQFGIKQTAKAIKNTTDDLYRISREKVCNENDIMNEIENRDVLVSICETQKTTKLVQHKKDGGKEVVKKSGKRNAESKSSNFKINSTKRTSIGRKNVTTLGIVLEEGRQFNKKKHKILQLNSTISSCGSRSKLNSHFKHMIDSWRQVAANGNSLIDYLNDSKEKKRKSKISEKNRNLSIKKPKEKTRKTTRTSTPKNKRKSKRAVDNNSLDISDIDEEIIAKKYVSVSDLAENTKHIEKINEIMDKPSKKAKALSFDKKKIDNNALGISFIGKELPRITTKNYTPVKKTQVLLDNNYSKNKEFTKSNNNENEESINLSNQSRKKSMDKKTQEDRDKIVIISNIQLDPWNRAPLRKILNDQQDKIDVTESISQKSNVEEPTMGHNSNSETYQRENKNLWHMEGFMHELAPSWTATAYFNDQMVTIKSSDYIGKYLVLFFYPLDFANHPYAEPPLEILAINDSYKSFIELNTEVIGCSVDSYFTHRAWLNYDVKKTNNIKSLNFPLLADGNHKISKAYRMYSEKLGHSYRGFYIMDPKGIIFAITVADLNIPIQLDDIFLRIRCHQSRNSM